MIISGLMEVDNYMKYLYCIIFLFIILTSPVRGENKELFYVYYKWRFEDMKKSEYSYLGELYCLLMKYSKKYVKYSDVGIFLDDADNTDDSDFIVLNYFINENFNEYYKKDLNDRKKIDKIVQSELDKVKNIVCLKNIPAKINCELLNMQKYLAFNVVVITIFESKGIGVEAREKSFMVSWKFKEKFGSFPEWYDIYLKNVREKSISDKKMEISIPLYFEEYGMHSLEESLYSHAKGIVKKMANSSEKEKIEELLRYFQIKNINYKDLLSEIKKEKDLD